MRPPQFCILGGGLSGLSVAYFLQQGFTNLPQGCIKLLERANDLGGWVYTNYSSHYIQEKGPTHFHLGGTGSDLLGLIKKLGLQSDVIIAEKQAASLRNFMRENGKLHNVPSRLDFFRFLPGLLKELNCKPNHTETDIDESIYDFSMRHIGPSLTQEITVPVIASSYLGDPQSLSVRSLFPLAYNLDKVTGSVLKGSRKMNKKGFPLVDSTLPSWLHTDKYDTLKQQIQFYGGNIYKLRNGCKQLISALHDNITKPSFNFKPVEILISKEAIKIQRNSTPERPIWKIYTSDGGFVEADCIISCIPSFSISKVLSMSEIPVNTTALCNSLDSIKHNSATRVNISFDTSVLKRYHRGSGYYSHHQIGNDVEGLVNMSWLSNLFPEQSKNLSQILMNSPSNTPTQLSSLVSNGNHPIRDNDIDRAVYISLEALKNTLNITENPIEIQPNPCPFSFPQYEIGHHEKLEQIEAIRSQHLPWLHFSGASFHTPMISELITDSRILCNSLFQKYHRFPVLHQYEDDLKYRGANRYIKSDE